MSAGFAGRLRARVAWLSPTGGRDALGAAEQNWTLHDMLWAAVEPEGRGPLVAAEAASAMTVWRVTMRPCAIAVGDRIELDWATIDVREVRRDPRRPDRVVAIGEEVR